MTPTRESHAGTNQLTMPSHHSCASLFRSASQSSREGEVALRLRGQAGRRPTALSGPDLCRSPAVPWRMEPSPARSSTQVVHAATSAPTYKGTCHSPTRCASVRKRSNTRLPRALRWRLPARDASAPRPSPHRGGSETSVASTLPARAAEHLEHEFLLHRGQRVARLFGQYAPSSTPSPAASSRLPAERSTATTPIAGSTGQLGDEVPDRAETDYCNRVPWSRRGQLQAHSAHLGKTCKRCHIDREVRGLGAAHRPAPHGRSGPPIGAECGRAQLYPPRCRSLRPAARTVPAIAYPGKEGLTRALGVCQHPGRSSRPGSGRARSPGL